MNFKTLFFISAVAGLAMSCQQQPAKVVAASTEAPKAKYELMGYATKEAWGEHLVSMIGCDDCHSPKIINAQGLPEVDPNLRLSGHHASFPPLDIDRAPLEQKGFGACNSHLTAWAGPWGISYAANLTSHATGIGNWPEENFFRAIRHGKFKGLENGRPLLPPMPWFAYANMTDDELSAIFAYLKTVPPVENIVPSPEPPIAAAAVN